jgi:hypothetical protein
MASTVSPIRLLLIAFAWTIAVGLGMNRLLEYENTAAPAGVVASRWPETSSLPRRAGRPTLVMLAHPRCPCTRASLGELEIIAAQTQGLLDLHVVFLQSKAFDYRSGLWRTAVALPGANVRVDPDGVEIGRFGALASGHVLLYDAAGRLAFSGGITSSRGHSGANTGRDAVVTLARQGRAEVLNTPVFGCALHDRAAARHR